MKKISSYNLSADIVRILAIIGVVLIHTTNAVYTRIDFFGGITWWISILLDSLSRISIPLFLLLSGYFILKKDESMQQSLKRIFVRIGIPLLFWLEFYNWYGGGLPDWHRVSFSIVSKLFFVDVYHLYYLVIIIGLYFIVPLIRSYFKNISEGSQKWFTKIVLLLGVSEVGLQYIFHACLSQNFFSIWIPFTGLFVTGYVLGWKAKKFSKIKLSMGYAVGLLATIAGNYLTYYLLLHHNKMMSPSGCLSNYTDYYLSINVVLMSVCAFLLLMQHKFVKIQKNAFVAKMVRSLAGASFGIYLIHPVVNRWLEVQFHLAVDFSPLPLNEIIFLKFFLVLGISYCLTVLISKIHVLKYVVGGR